MVLLCLVSFWGEGAIAGQVLNATPTTYRSLIGTLQPGDTLTLEAGTYVDGLPISNRHGEAGNPIVITGPESGAPAVFEGSRTQAWNTVQINNSSYITLRHLTLDGLDVPYLDAVNAGGTTHHITLENLLIIRHGGNGPNTDSQLTVGIATRGPAWDWVIRNNTIIGAGTGMYLGNWQGVGWPFVGGLIEHNVILDTLGYNIQIKQMTSRNDGSGNPVSGMPTEDRKTIIRHNVFSKANNASTFDDPNGGYFGPRPNLLVGHFPLSGPGSNDVYEIYGNFFYDNPTEALFQGEGNIAMYDNVFYNPSGKAINIQPHNNKPHMIRVFHNTVVATGSGIRVAGADTLFDQWVLANAVFAGTPISADAQVVLQENLTNTYASAGNYLNNPAGDPNMQTLDMYPLSGMLSGPVVDMSALQSFDDSNLDFNGDTRDGSFRGAYSGSGQNPGWVLALDTKPEVATVPQAPSIALQPMAASVEEGQTASFSVMATGTAPMAYQWRKDGVDIPTASGASYTTSATTLADNGAVFDCMVSNGAGSVVSNGVVLTVNADVTAPQLSSVTAGVATVVMVSFSEAVEQSTAEDLANYSIDGGITAQSATLAGDQKTVQLTVSELSDGSAYTLTVSGVTDRAATPNTIAAFSSLGFTYHAVEDFESGTAANWTPLTAGRWSVVQDGGDYAYYLNTSAYEAQSGDRLGEYALLPGAFGDFELSLQARLGDAIAGNPQADYAVVFGYQDADNYYYMMFNADMAYTQLYKVVNGSRVVVASAASDWLNDEAYHSIGVTRSGNAITVTFDGSEVLSVSDSSFGAGQVGIGSFNDAAYFDDIQLVAGTGGSGGTNLAISGQPAADTVTEGQTASFTVTAMGGSNLSYQWRKDGIAITGANSASYTTPATVLGDNGAVFDCVVANGTSSVTSVGAVLTVAGTGDTGGSNKGGGGATGPLLLLVLVPLSYARRRRENRLLSLNQEASQ